MSLAAVIFDLDGVLLDSEGVWNAARKEVAVPNREFPPGEHALALAHDVLDSLEDLTPARVRAAATAGSRGSAGA